MPEQDPTERFRTYLRQKGVTDEDQIMLAVKVMLLLHQVFPRAKQQKKMIDVSRDPQGGIIINLGCPLTQGWAIAYNIGSTTTDVNLTFVSDRKNIQTMEDKLTNKIWTDFLGWTFKAGNKVKTDSQRQTNTAYQQLRAAQHKSWRSR